MVPFSSKAEALLVIVSYCAVLVHLSPEGRGRASAASEGEGVRMLQIFLELPNPLTPTLSPLGRGSAPCQRCRLHLQEERLIKRQHSATRRAPWRARLRRSPGRPACLRNRRYRRPCRNGRGRTC